MEIMDSTSTEILTHNPLGPSQQETLQAFKQLQTHLNHKILGQEKFIERILIALLADGHLLVEGVPGLAKTKTIKELAQCLDGNFHRVQFTSDLMPEDIVGAEIYRPQDGSVSFHPGPLFHNLILADEINRAPARVQAALLEALAERQVTIGRTTYPLPKLFLVMATQNPLHHAGTHPLPEAQLDRFLMHVPIHHPDATTEQQILMAARQEQLGNKVPHPRLSQTAIFKAREETHTVHMNPAIQEYLVQLVMATREPSVIDKQLGEWIQLGISPRGTISLDRCTRAYAWLNQRDYVIPEDIHAVVDGVFWHRLILSERAVSAQISPQVVIQRLLSLVPVP